jgi:hypothetical protein
VVKVLPWWRVASDPLWQAGETGYGKVPDDQAEDMAQDDAFMRSLSLAVAIREAVEAIV